MHEASPNFHTKLTRRVCSDAVCLVETFTSSAGHVLAGTFSNFVHRAALEADDLAGGFGRSGDELHLTAVLPSTAGRLHLSREIEVTWQLIGWLEGHLDAVWRVC